MIALYLCRYIRNPAGNSTLNSAHIREKIEV
jgi:hypothetical protein